MCTQNCAKLFVQTVQVKNPPCHRFTIQILKGGEWSSSTFMVLELYGMVEKEVPAEQKFLYVRDMLLTC